MKKITKLLALLLAVVMVLSCIAGCKKKPTTDPTNGDNAAKAEYTYRGYTQQMGTNWNPHTWETDPDNSILSYLETPLATMSIKDSVNGIYQWVFKAATSVTDVTKLNKSDLTKYNVSLPAGVTVDDVLTDPMFNDMEIIKYENGQMFISTAFLIDRAGFETKIELESEVHHRFKIKFYIA